MRPPRWAALAALLLLARCGDDGASSKPCDAATGSCPDLSGRFAVLTATQPPNSQCPFTPPVLRGFVDVVQNGNLFETSIFDPDFKIDVTLTGNLFPASKDNFGALSGSGTYLKPASDGGWEIRITLNASLMNGTGQFGTRATVLTGSYIFVGTQINDRTICTTTSTFQASRTGVRSPPP